MLKYSRSSVLDQRHWSLPVAENLKKKHILCFVTLRTLVNVLQQKLL